MSNYDNEMRKTIMEASSKLDALSVDEQIKLYEETVGFFDYVTPGTEPYSQALLCAAALGHRLNAAREFISKEQYRKTAKLMNELRRAIEENK